ncbi:MAG: PEP-CTERM sorting domain-containing protein [bacterium]|nr:PEP-CTERM sorting domain-containing protein [bacterium]
MIHFAEVPEPGTGLLFAAGLSVLAAKCRSVSRQPGR